MILTFMEWLTRDATWIMEAEQMDREPMYYGKKMGAYHGYLVYKRLRWKKNDLSIELDIPLFYDISKC